VGVALEKQVLKVVGQAGVVGGVVLVAGADDDLRIEPWRFVVLREINGQAVVQLVDTDARGVVVGGP